MAELPITTIDNEVSPERIPELDVSSFEEIETWYRNLRPDRDIRTVPFETHLDATASAVLHATERELPAGSKDRVRAALGLTADIQRTSREVALAGSQSLLVSDLLLELVERGEQLPKQVASQLLGVSSSIARTIRDNPLTDSVDRVKANARFYNAEHAKLTHDVAGVAEDKKSETYIGLVRGEARWMSEHTRGVPGGALFETYIGCLAKYQVWVAEEEDRQTARHTTLREDRPSPKDKGGSGFKTAHDVTISSKAARARLQCKWGPAAAEFGVGRYDETKVMPIIETGDQGVLENREMLEKAFMALAKSSDEENMQFCDSMSERYRLPEIISGIHNTVPHGAGALALANS